MCDASLGAGRRAVWGAERGATQTLGLGDVPHLPLLGPLDTAHIDTAHRRGEPVAHAMYNVTNPGPNYRLD